MAGLTLALDASTYRGSVALLRDGVVIAQRDVAMKGADEERLMPAVAAVLESAGEQIANVDAVVCGDGPGSFTSLRIAAAIAKGLVSGTNARLYAVPSLALAAVEAGIGRWMVTIDALREEVFAVLAEWDGATLRVLAHAPLIRSVADARAAAEAAGAHYVIGHPHARAVAALLDAVLASGDVDVAAWEPAYGRRAEAQVRWEAEKGRPLFE